MKVRARIGNGPWHGELACQTVDMDSHEAVALHARMDADMRQLLAAPHRAGSWRREILIGYSKALADSARLRGAADLGTAQAERPAILRELRSRFLLAQCETALNTSLRDW